VAVPSTPGLIGPNEAVKILGIHKPQLYRAMEAGAIPTKDVAGKRMIIREGLEEAWENRPRRLVRGPTSEAGKARAKERQSPPPPSRAEQDWPDPPGERPDGLPPRPNAEETPNLEVQKAWREYELRRKAHRENLVNEGILIFKSDMEAAFNGVLAELLNRAHEVGRQVTLLIPQLKTEEVEIIDKVVLQLFEEVSRLDFENLKHDQ
jgi:hypothetical protein